MKQLMRARKFKADKVRLVPGGGVWLYNNCSKEASNSHWSQVEGGGSHR